MDDQRIILAAQKAVQQNPVLAAKLGDSLQRAVAMNYGSLIKTQPRPSNLPAFRPAGMAGVSRAEIADLVSDAVKAELAKSMGGTYAFTGSDFNKGIAGAYVGDADPRYYGPVSTIVLTVADNAAAGTTFTATLPPSARARMADGVIKRIAAASGAQTQSGGILTGQSQKVSVSLFINGVTFRPIAVNLSYFLDTALGTPQGYSTDIRVKPTDSVELVVTVDQTLTGIAGQSSELVFTYDVASI